jgi:hypothetical protein
MKINDGSNWQEAKSLKVNDGSSWLTAKKAYVYDNGWKIAYPNLPKSTGLAITYSTTYQVVGTVFSVTGNWNMDPSYAPDSYTYQWKRGSTNIPGATSSTYTATTSDVDYVIGLSVTATNGRGSTTVTTSGNGALVAPIVTSMYAYDATSYPSTPSVSISQSGISYSGSWTSSSNATSYTVTTNNGSVTDNGNQTFSGTGNAGSPVTVTITPINSNKQVYMFWTPAEGAASYDVVKYGNNIQTVINVPASQTNYTWSIADGNEGNYFTVYPKTPAGYSGYGIQTSVQASNKSGNSGSATLDSLGCTIGYITDWTYGGLTWSGNCVNNSEDGTYSYRYATYRNSDCSTQDIYEYGSYSTSRYCVPTCTAGWIDDYTYNNITWSGTCASNSLEGGTAANRTRTYRYADCSTAVITEYGPFYQSRSCTYVNCQQCNSYSGNHLAYSGICSSGQAYYRTCYTPVGCNDIEQFVSCYTPPAVNCSQCNSYSGQYLDSNGVCSSGQAYYKICYTPVGCDNIIQFQSCYTPPAASGKGLCLSYDVTNSASAFYYDCYSVGQCNTHTTNNRTPC